jgi:hypothetical protein
MRTFVPENRDGNTLALFRGPVEPRLHILRRRHEWQHRSAVEQDGLTHERDFEHLGLDTLAALAINTSPDDIAEAFGMRWGPTRYTLHAIRDPG